MMNYFCEMFDGLIFSHDHCQRFSPQQISGCSSDNNYTYAPFVLIFISPTLFIFSCLSSCRFTTLLKTNFCKDSGFPEHF